MHAVRESTATQCRAAVDCPRSVGIESWHAGEYRDGFGRACVPRSFWKSCANTCLPPPQSPHLLSCTLFYHPPLLSSLTPPTARETDTNWNSTRSRRYINIVQSGSAKVPEPLCQAQQSPLLPADGAGALRRACFSAGSPAAKQAPFCMLLQARNSHEFGN